MTHFFEKRQIVIPGDLISEGEYNAGPNTYKEDKRIFSLRVGLFESRGKNVEVVPLNTFYFPMIGDLVIGKIIDISLFGWTVDIDAPYSAVLRTSEARSRPFRHQKDELSDFLTIGDMILTKIISFDRTNDPSLTLRERGLGKLSFGQIIKVSPAKIPRIIGRKGSMIGMLKKETNCNLTVGQNGLVHISGKSRKHEQIAILAIRKIEEEAHTSGLTDRITGMINRIKGETE